MGWGGVEIVGTSSSGLTRPYALSDGKELGNNSSMYLGSKESLLMVSAIAGLIH